MQAYAEQVRRNSTSERLKPAPVFTEPVTFHYEIQNHTTRMQKLTKAFQVYRLMALTVICVLAGIIIGLMCRPRAKFWTERQFMYIEFPGELYLRFLKLMIIPLLVSNVILSFGTIQGKISSKLAKVAGLLYLASNCVAITIAIVVTIIIRPGSAPNESSSHSRQHSSHHSTINDYSTNTNHHLLHDQHDSIARYREYHPMFYHTNPDKSSPPAQSSNLRPFVSQKSRPQLAPTGDWGQLNDRTTTFTLPNLRQPALEHERPNLEQQHDDGEVDQEDLINFDDELAHLVRSIERSSSVFREGSRIGLSTKLPIDVVLDALRNIVPDSLIGAALQQSRTRLFTPKELRIERNGSTDPPPNRWLMGHELINQPNVIGLLVMSVMTGVVLSHMGEASKPMLDLCSCISELSLRIGMKAIHTAPFCIMFLLIGQIARARDLSLMAGELLMYVLTVIIALSLHGAIILPLVYYLVTKKSPLVFFKGLLQALVASFATSSSSATMALVLNCLSELDLNLIIVRAFGPLGSVFNMNGTSIFESVAVIFISQILGVKLPLTSLLLIGFCSAIASLSTSGIPSSGMMTMVIVLNAINLPVLELSLIYIVDFIIDRFRTVINVWSGAIVCGLIDHICPEELFEEEMKPEKYREMVRYRGSRTSLTGRKSSQVDDKPQVISVTITPPPIENNRNI
uniref:Amino acid transporter n=1 Tax=Aceria tosichella TaxID=561515 RepID=A0A6G1SCM2_9ACAR